MSAQTAKKTKHAHAGHAVPKVRVPAQTAQTAAKPSKGKVLPIRPDAVPGRRRSDRKAAETETPTATKVEAKPKTPAPAAAATETGSLSALNVVAKWNAFPHLRALAFDRLCEKRQRLADEIAFRKTTMSALDEEIEAALTLAGTEKVEWEQRPVMICHSRSGATIQAEKLLERGVSPDDINAATKPGTDYSYVLFGKAKVD